MMLARIRLRYLYYLSWFVAIAALLGSLYFSQILHYAPCLLCWYQRIFMYPLVVILGVGILRRDEQLPLYVLPLSLIGTGFAFFHYLLERGIIAESYAPCTAGVSCTTQYIDWFNFITIPFLSLIAFIVISVCMVLANQKTKERI